MSRVTTNRENHEIEWFLGRYIWHRRSREYTVWGGFFVSATYTDSLYIVFPKTMDVRDKGENKE